MAGMIPGDNQAGRAPLTGPDDLTGDATHTRELVRRSQAGEQEALDELFTRYYDRVHRIVHVRLGAKIRLRAESIDIVQEVFAEALLDLDRFEMREPASLIRWLAKIAEHRISTAAKRVNAQKQDPRRETPLLAPASEGGAGFDPAAESTQPPERLLRDERERLVDDCVAELPSDWREVLILRDYEGGSWAYVAEQLGRSEGAAQMLHKRARESLREALVRRGLGGPRG